MSGFDLETIKAELRAIADDPDYLLNALAVRTQQQAWKLVSEVERLAHVVLMEG